MVPFKKIRYNLTQLVIDFIPSYLTVLSGKEKKLIGKLNSEKIS